MNLDERMVMERIKDDLLDSYDEELELELEDHFEEGVHSDNADPSIQEERRLARRLYFKELFRLQTELVKLQDWVADSGHKVVVIFEGRDAAGKGGVIKRITQRLNPRICRIAALPHRMNANVRSGIFNAMCRIYRRRVKSSCLIAAGITALA